jgi:hypothetical protein
MKQYSMAALTIKHTRLKADILKIQALRSSMSLRRIYLLRAQIMLLELYKKTKSKRDLRAIESIDALLLLTDGVPIHIFYSSKDKLEVKKTFFNGQCVVDINFIPQGEQG